MSSNRRGFFGQLFKGAAAAGVGAVAAKSSWADDAVDKAIGVGGIDVKVSGEHDPRELAREVKKAIRKTEDRIGVQSQFLASEDTKLCQMFKTHRHLRLCAANNSVYVRDHNIHAGHFFASEYGNRDNVQNFGSSVYVTGVVALGSLLVDFSTKTLEPRIADISCCFDEVSDTIDGSSTTDQRKYMYGHVYRVEVEGMGSHLFMTGNKSSRRSFSRKYESSWENEAGVLISRKFEANSGRFSWWVPERHTKVYRVNRVSNGKCLDTHTSFVEAKKQREAFNHLNKHFAGDENYCEIEEVKFS